VAARPGESEVTRYLESENAFAEARLAPLAGLRDQIYEEMLSHMKQTDVSVPYRDGAWWYYTRTEEGLQYAIYCRKPGTAAGPDADAPEAVVLDGNVLSEEYTFFAIGDSDISDDGRWLAYSTDTTGFRQYTLHIKTWRAGRPCPARWSGWARSAGPRTTARCITPWKTSSRSASSNCGGPRPATQRLRPGLSG